MMICCRQTLVLMPLMFQVSELDVQALVYVGAVCVCVCVYVYALLCVCVCVCVCMP